MAPDSASLQRTPGPAAPALTVFYDGSCPLCRREIDFYRRRRGAARIDWLDISGLPEGEVAPGLSRCAALDERGWYHNRLPIPGLKEAFGLLRIEPETLPEAAIQFEYGGTPPAAVADQAYGSPTTVSNR